MKPTNLDNLGQRALAEAGELLKALSEQGHNIDGNGLKICFNYYSGYVFLMNEDFDVLMLNGKGELKQYYTTPYAGIEGFLEELEDEYEDMEDEDKEYFEQIYLNETGKEYEPQY